MKTPASIARHPIHPMLIVIPIGLWIFSLVADIIVHVSGDEAVQTLWFTLAYYTMAGGLVGALVAAFPGLIDFLSMSPGRIRKLATMHMALNLTVVVLYAVNLWLRTTSPPSADLGFALSLLAVVLLGFSGWIGGEMVHVHGVGVSAPASDVVEPAPRVATERGGRSGSQLGST
jgi:uncharacterized membrane protein